MTTETREPAKNPCGSCPYRQDVPAGVWAEEEYAKLPAYDEPETFMQPIGLFHCHQQDGRLCAGWVGCHDMEHNFALRVNARFLSPKVIDAILGYQTKVPLFGSGQEAADHGRSGIENPDLRARKTVAKIISKQ